MTKLSTSTLPPFIFFKKFRIIFLVLASSIFLFTGCKKDIQMNEPQTSEVESISALPGKINAVSPKLGKYPVISSSGENERGKSISTELLKLDPQYREMVMRALKLSEATCDDNTRLNQWLDRQLTDWSVDAIVAAINVGMLDLPTYHALLFENKSWGQYFGQRGEYTIRLIISFLKLKHFWDIESKDIVLAGLHGSMLRDRYKLYSTYRFVYGLSSDDALSYAKLTQQLLRAYPEYRNGNHPIFTFNAFSQSSFYFPEIGVIPPKIVIGDGILDGFSAIGYRDVAPQAILAHEFGHQVQFQLGIFNTTNTPESTRRLELMADAFSAYYLSHIRGEFMRWGRYRQFLQVFFNIGDCATTSSGHHGTPNQRMAAAEWAYNVAKSAHRQGRVLPSRIFAQMFDAALPQILAH